ncbi:MAG: hypothetical protein WCY62_08390 [Clostridia bacterium]|jgi:hypothetical protein
MNEIMNWLLDGDVAIQYMTHKHILHSDQAVLDQLQNRIATEGFGKKFLSCRSENGHWGLHYYQPKWTSTHYTLLDLKNLCISESLEPCREMVIRMLKECMNSDGGVNLSKYEHPSDICVDGMVLNYASYFCADDPHVIRLAEHLVSVQKTDGGFTWDILSEKGDPHTTICVLEGLGQFNASVPGHGLTEIEKVKKKAVEFLLSNKLFIDDADKRYRKLSYPYRYRYDLLRVLEYFSDQHISYDGRMQPAIDWLYAKRRVDGLWYMENQHKGNVHFQMEKLGKPSRYITSKALYICRYFGTLS